MPSEADAAAAALKEADDAAAQLRQLSSRARNKKVRSAEYDAFRRTGMHVSVLTERSTWCLVCSHTDNSGDKPRRVGGRTRHKCAKCNVALCTVKRGDAPACFEFFHSAHENHEVPKRAYVRKRKAPDGRPDGEQGGADEDDGDAGMENP